MKKRLDFVTNSSSSSFCVVLSVNTNAGKELKLDFWPEDADGGEEINIPLREDVESLLDKIKACETVENLRDVLLESISLGGMFPDIEDFLLDEMDEDEYEQMSTSKFLSKASKLIKDEDEDFDEYEDVMSEVKGKIAKFKRAINKIKSLDEIKSIEIREEMSGWGEFARDSASEYLEKILDADLDTDDSDAVKEALKDKLKDYEIASILDHLENDSICQLDADITTTYLFEDRKIEKRYRFDADH